MSTIPTSYSLGSDSKLYTESVGTLRAQVNGVYALSVIFLIICWITVGLRTYVRTFMLKAMAQDDWWLIATQVSLHHASPQIAYRSFANTNPCRQLIFSIYSVLLCVICTELNKHITEYAAGEVPTSKEVPNVRNQSLTNTTSLSNQPLTLFL